MRFVRKRKPACFHNMKSRRHWAELLVISEMDNVHPVFDGTGMLYLCHYDCRNKTLRLKRLGRLVRQNNSAMSAEFSEFRCHQRGIGHEEEEAFRSQCAFGLHRRILPCISFRWMEDGVVVVQCHIVERKLAEVSIVVVMASNSHGKRKQAPASAAPAAWLVPEQRENGTRRALHG